MKSTSPTTRTSPPKKKAPLPTPGSSLVPAGRIAGLFGIRGELKCDPSPAGRSAFVCGATMTCASHELRLTSVREHRARLIVAFEGYATAESAQPLVGATLYVPRAALPLGEDEYLDADLVGCAVYLGEKMIGAVSGIEHSAAQDRLVVDGKRIPLVREFVQTIDTAARRIDVRVPAGLLDETRAENG